MRLATRAQIVLFLARIRGAAVIGALFGAAAGAALLSPPLMGASLGAISGAVDFATLALLIGGAETFLPRTRLGRVFERAPFLAGFAVKAIAYSLVILCVIGGRLGPNVVNLIFGGDQVQAMRQQVERGFPLGLVIPIAFLVTFFFLLLHQLRYLVGERALRDIVWGRYHRARTEERFFLFVDIAGSTPLAERIGPVAVNRFLDLVFRLASDPVDDHGGEVYQYVGDEMVITWTLADGRTAARPIACFYAIERALAEAAEGFQREFATVPRLHAALHAGPVITGEVGGNRRAIVFHGDVMNTTSRIENATRDLRRPFLASEDALNRLQGTGAYTLQDLGPQQLRGREAPVRLYAVEPK
jgi:adenylate cyclase